VNDFPGISEEAPLKAYNGIGPIQEMMPGQGNPPLPLATAPNAVEPLPAVWPAPLLPIRPYNDDVILHDGSACNSDGVVLAR
jgi:hypothetical protein